MSGISVEVHSEATSASLRSLANNLQDRKVANQAVAVQLSSWIARNFDAEGALNIKWAQLSPGTANRRVNKRGDRRGYDHILVSSGLMRASFAKFRYDNDTATVGTDATYAPFHELGLPEKNLPARPMLPPVDIALHEAMDVYNYYISKSIRDAGFK